MAAAGTKAEATPSAVSDAPRTLTIKSATVQYIETTRAIAGLKSVQQDAAKFLLDAARRTGRRTFGDDIAVVQTGGSEIHDQAKAKDFILEMGRSLDDFKIRTKLGLALKLLK